MKVILKIFVLPVLLIISLAYLLGKLVTNLISYAVTVLLLVIGGCAIYCVVKAMWTSLAILAVLGLIAFLFLFFLVWAVFKAEMIVNALREFIWS